MKGSFYGVGVGPGDPELITVKAVKLINEAEVLLLPASQKSECRAYNIARAAVSDIDNKDCIFSPFPMTMDKASLEKFHLDTAKMVEAYLERGKNVAFLTIGDPCIYSTFEYIEKLISKRGYKTQYISGVTSFCASAARVGESLAQGKEEIHIIPGLQAIEEALKLNGTKVFMKSGKQLEKLKEHLINNGKTHNYDVFSVSNCGMDSEVICKGAGNIPVDAGYLTVVVVKEHKDESE